MFKLFILALSIFNIVEGQDNCTETIGDGRCDSENNNSDCGYDGGDCCLCTCISNPDGCTTNSFVDCIDPEIESMDEIFGCEEKPIYTTCPIGTQKWTVNNEDDANSLSIATSCYGGIFEVEWEGDVTLEKDIQVLGGSTLRVSGKGTSSIHGLGTRLFTVDNSKLVLNGINITSGTSSIGGAIASRDSILLADQVQFIDNSATYGGALFISGESTTTLENDLFSMNSASLDGGAIYTSSSLTIKEVVFSDNHAGMDSGGIYVGNNNSLYASETMFFNNSAGKIGGCITAGFDTKIYWEESNTFDSNTAASGGCIFSVGEIMVFNGNSSFTSNSASSSGGVFTLDKMVVIFNETTIFEGNIAYSTGGTMNIRDSNVSFAGDILFKNNMCINILS